MEDVDRPSDVYWSLWNVPGRDLIPRNLPRQAVLQYPIKGLQGRNVRGEHGYAPPCPDPEGHYVIRAYGLEKELDLDPATATKEELVKAIELQAREYGENHVVYTRNRQWSSSYEY